MFKDLLKAYLPALLGAVCGGTAVALGKQYPDVMPFWAVASQSTLYTLATLFGARQVQKMTPDSWLHPTLRTGTEGLMPLPPPKLNLPSQSVQVPQHPIVDGDPDKQ